MQTQQKQDLLTRLRQAIDRLENRSSPYNSGQFALRPGKIICKPDQNIAHSLPHGCFNTGASAFDTFFTMEALRCGVLYDIIGKKVSDGGDSGALTGFTMALLYRLLAVRPGLIFWVITRQTFHENGMLYAPALEYFAIDPAWLIILRAPDTRAALWAMEEAANIREITAVVGEFTGRSSKLDMTATRRLALRSAMGGTTIFMLRHGALALASAAAGRFAVSPIKSARPFPDLYNISSQEFIGRPAWRILLEKNRYGRLGTAGLEWNHVEKKITSKTFSQPLVSRILNQSA